ncbi:three-Cys-motif partner protein TcmP [Tunturiibacter psychrotolerans]|uniref:three-Cys-motif partner protein TcmP n=1 Tax=Tunturiibacter psychrotolerans TaxID=3069686 RepID=UPI003D9AD1F2
MRKYLAAYQQIFTKNLKPSYFTTWYVDAFAGTGSRTPTESRSQDLGMFAEVYEDADTSQYRDGSARIALGLSNPFDKYLFIEQSAIRAGELKDCIRKDFPKLLERCELRNDDANVILRQWCKERDWRKGPSITRV